jgi:hypothetical protein
MSIVPKEVLKEIIARWPKGVATGTAFDLAEFAVEEVAKWALEQETTGQAMRVHELETENAALKARVAHLESLIADIATVAGRGTPDAIDNDGYPYQSAALATVMERAKR